MSPRRISKVTTRKVPTKARLSASAAPATASAKSFPIVAIGASAGGLEAMSLLLKALPLRTGMAFVLVQHLDPTHESALTSLLSRITEMPVKEARNNEPARPDHLYVIPPNKLMGIAGGKLKLFARGEEDGHLPINEFFRTLARQVASRPVGLVLSRTASPPPPRSP